MGEAVERREAPTFTPVPLMAQDERAAAWRLAGALAKSGGFKGIPSTEGGQALAFTKMALGRDLGLSAVQSLMCIDIVEGNASVRSVTLAGFVKRHERYDYKITAHDVTRCVIEFWQKIDDDAPRTVVGLDDPAEHGWGLLGESEYTIEDARRADLVKPRSNWEKSPRNMVFARSMSNGVKWYMPDLMGGVPIYTEGDVFTVVRDGAEEATAGSVAEDTLAESVSKLGLAPKLDTELREAIDRLNELSPGAWGPARVQMVFGGQDEAFVLREVVAIEDEIESLEDEARNAAEAPEAVVVDEGEPSFEAACPECGRPEGEHTQAEMMACMAAADEAADA